MENTLTNFNRIQRERDNRMPPEEEPEPLEGNDLFLKVMNDMRVKRLGREE